MVGFRGLTLIFFFLNGEKLSHYRALGVAMVGPSCTVTSRRRASASRLLGIACGVWQHHCLP